uniref:Uncharacterized protein n=1 Tax=Caenorhabditis japonica TaxID=281687 RepID=A0A8R1EWQ4_CAEJA
MAPIKKQKSAGGVKRISLAADDVTPAKGVEEKMSWKEYKKMRKTIGAGNTKRPSMPSVNDDDEKKKPKKLTKSQKRETRYW